MAALREIKDRISSVRSTLKITSAMKLVASAKLRKAQQAVEAMVPYQKELSRVLEEVRAVAGKSGEAVPAPETGKVAVVCVSSNSSLCGAFNGNVIRKALSVLGEYGGDADVYAVGKKMAERLRKEGYGPVGDYNYLVASPGYAEASEFAQKLIDSYDSGVYSKVVLVYTHFVSASRQVVKVETYLPFVLDDTAGSEAVDFESKYIMEPSARQIAEAIMPQVMRLKVYTVLLDSLASEHAARTVAMQAATDNGKELLDELTLEYNKGRQGKITSEILDLAGGQQR
ncbi:MAG: ATP synthase F1 subunit gamma [Bacteroidales bacterium]|nr:ATP synthase F1 subunit gamma [Bacteroidales bacterium]